MQTADLIWMLVGLLLTLMVFFYFLGDNFLFRIVSYIFVGVSAAYVAVVVIYQVLIPRLVQPMLTGDLTTRLATLIPLVGGAFLLTKISPRLAFLGKPSTAYLVGVGAAVAVGGAVFGTLLGQISASASPFNLSAPGGGISRLLEGVIVLLGTIGTLFYFQFSARAAGSSGQPAKRPALVEGLALVGQVFIGVTLGALFAGVYASSLSALMERLGFIFTVIANLKF
jgi:hypothetical protein